MKAHNNRNDLLKQLEGQQTLKATQSGFFNTLFGRENQIERDRNRVVVVDGRNLAWIFEDSKLKNGLSDWQPDQTLSYAAV